MPSTDPKVPCSNLVPGSHTGTVPVPCKASYISLGHCPGCPGAGSVGAAGTHHPTSAWTCELRPHAQSAATAQVAMRRPCRRAAFSLPSMAAARRVQQHKRWRTSRAAHITQEVWCCLRAQRFDSLQGLSSLAASTQKIIHSCRHCQAMACHGSAVAMIGSGTTVRAWGLAFLQHSRSATARF